MNELTTKIKVARGVILTLLCFLLWIALSREFNIWSLSIGLIFSLVAMAYSYRIFFDEQYYRSDLLIRIEYFTIYLLLLAVQSYIASFELIWRMITRKYNPDIVRIKLRLNSRIGKVSLANTITMIPGTLALWLDGNHLYVHWFDKKTDHKIQAGNLIKQDFEKILQKIFG